MKFIYIVAEGQTEQEFTNEVLKPYFEEHDILIKATLIRTSKCQRGGFVNYDHLKNTINGLLKQSPSDSIITTFVDFFRIPTNMPNYVQCMSKQSKIEQVEALEQAIEKDIANNRFIPYIQLHEFEALLFSNNKGFEYLSDMAICCQTKKIIEQYSNPEEINSTPEGAPSKRLIAIKKDYDKVLEGSLIALEIGIKDILNKCPRFCDWTKMLIAKAKN